MARYGEDMKGDRMFWIGFAMLWASTPIAILVGAIVLEVFFHGSLHNGLIAFIATCVTAGLGMWLACCLMQRDLKS